MIEIIKLIFLVHLFTSRVPNMWHNFTLLTPSSLQLKGTNLTQCCKYSKTCIRNHDYMDLWTFSWLLTPSCPDAKRICISMCICRMEWMLNWWLGSAKVFHRPHTQSDTCSLTPEQDGVNNHETSYWIDDITASLIIDNTKSNNCLTNNATLHHPQSLFIFT